jgi:hypothetical protein
LIDSACQFGVDRDALEDGFQEQDRGLSPVIDMFSNSQNVMFENLEPVLWFYIKAEQDKILGG